MSTPRIPSYRRHKPSDQAVVTLSGQDFYLGKWNTKASRQEYDRLIAEWIASGRCLLPAKVELTVIELAAAYKRFAKTYYLPGPHGEKAYDRVRRAMKLLGDAYGPTRVMEFGPLAFKAFRSRLEKPELSRSYVNMVCDIIRRAFKWGVGQELVPASVFHALQAVPGLRKGRSKARESEPVQPIDEATVDATLKHLSPVVADMVRLQRLTGMRPAEVCIVRPCDVDTVGDVWRYVPASHKAEHHDRSRVVFIGPRGQYVLRPYLLRDHQAFCFSPAEVDQKRRREAHEDRKTPLSCGNVPGSNRRRKPKRAPGTRYTTSSYRRAIHNAADKANEAARQEHGDVSKDQRIVPRWGPHRLRHTAATEIRRRFGLEAAQVALGHAAADVTQIYAERDQTLAAKVMKEVG